ncbi:hypothetical protein G6F31_016327 [Rhizopus arrhizus]|nr:hypothetical protein G6F31_016327 [Rhizopus arrhizus]
MGGVLRPASGRRGLAAGPPEADSRGLPVAVGALRGSDSNRFYRRHGFVQTAESEWDIDYLRPVPGQDD